MAEFSELIKKFDKIRDYMRDFYVYGFKSREDFTRKSARTYDNEKRRVESYLGEYMKWDYSGGRKTSFISVDSANIPLNPLYAAWKSKSFTANDIMLHFYILDVLKNTQMTADRLTDIICERSEAVMDTQTVRNKCNEYVKLGMLVREKQGKAYIYTVSDEVLSVSPELTDAVRFFQGAAPFGEIGSYILDNENKKNDLFAFKHHYIAHTLEDGVLFDLLSAIRQNRTVTFENHSERSGKSGFVTALPLRIFVSTVTGRRFVCMYFPGARRFGSFRLDYIKSVVLGKEADSAQQLKEKLSSNFSKVWGVGFGGKNRTETVCMKLFIDEKREQFVIDRVKREGQGGKLTKLEDNVFLFTKEMFDSSEMSPWIKTFIGRIIGLEGTNELVVNRFHGDIKLMADMYGIESESEREGS